MTSDETLACYLWITKTRSEYNYYREYIRDALTNSSGSINATLEQVRQLIRLRLNDDAPELGGVYSKLLTAALNEIDCNEIAQRLINGVYPEWKAQNGINTDEYEIE
jgi:hypothetical protein